MASPTTESVIVRMPDRLFPYEFWQGGLAALATQYQANLPVPHIHLAPFLQEDIVRQVALEFPGPNSHGWIQYRHYNENKLGKTDRTAFPSLTARVIDELNSREFIDWLSQLTGIPGLLPDASLEGGGLHQTERGGFLNVHADFTHHPHRQNWRRRCNLLLYLNEGWKEEWGGAIEFWNRDMTACVAKFPPKLNHAVIFNTTEDAYHGYPDPITPPEGVTRKSLALYYYTPETTTRTTRRSTNYRARPGDNFKAVFIWLDKQLLSIYSRVKTKLGLSDKFVSSVLGWLARRKNRS